MGTAALFHDLGMAKNASLYQKTEPLDDTEKLMLRLHPHNGANMLPESISPVVRTAVRDHHENQLGTGYPDRLPGDSINIFSRIIRIADAWCYATTNRAGYTPRLDALVLYDMLYGEYKRYYDLEILSVFGTLIPPFPVGAKLKLQDGRSAVVLRHNGKSPFQPEVIIAFDQWNQPLPSDQLESPFYLGQRPDARLHSFAGEDLSFLNEDLYNLPSEQKYNLVTGFSFP